MSDYTNQNDVHRGEGVGAKGLLVAALVIVAFIFGLAMLAEAPDPGAGGTTAPVETAPAVGSGAETAPAVPNQ